MKASQRLEINHPVLQETNLLRTTVDTVVCHFPLLGEDDVILLNGILDYVGCGQHLLSVLLGVGLNMTDLCRMGSPLYFSIVHLQKSVRRTINIFRSLSSPRIQVS